MLVLHRRCPASAQVGKSLGVVDANTATEQVLAGGAEHERAGGESAHRRAPVQQHRRSQQVPPQPEADAGTGNSVLRQGVRPREPEHRDRRRDHAHSRAPASGWRTSSRNIGRGGTGRSSRKRSASTSISRKSRGSRSTRSFPININTATRCRHPDDSGRRRAHAARVQGISPVEIDRAFP